MLGASCLLRACTCLDGPAASGADVLPCLIQCAQIVVVYAFNYSQLQSVPSMVAIQVCHCIMRRTTCFVNMQR